MNDLSETRRSFIAQELELILALWDVVGDKVGAPDNSLTGDQVALVLIRIASDCAGCDMTDFKV